MGDEPHTQISSFGETGSTERILAHESEASRPSRFAPARCCDRRYRCGPSNRWRCRGEVELIRFQPIVPRRDTFLFCRSGRAAVAVAVGDEDVAVDVNAMSVGFRCLILTGFAAGTDREQELPFRVNLRATWASVANHTLPSLSNFKASALSSGPLASFSRGCLAVDRTTGLARVNPDVSVRSIEIEAPRGWFRGRRPSSTTSYAGRGPLSILGWGVRRGPIFWLVRGEPGWGEDEGEKGEESGFLDRGVGEGNRLPILGSSTLALTDPTNDYLKGCERHRRGNTRAEISQSSAGREKFPPIHKNFGESGLYGQYPS
jgi:hypothetical protein